MASKSNINNDTLEADHSIHGHVLESIFSHVPLIDLAPASFVSKGWNRSVFLSLCHVSKPKPWFMVHMQNTRSNVVSTMRAFDPRSEMWVEIEAGPPIKHETMVRSSNSNLLYTISPSKFSFSVDPFHMTWHHAGPPKVSRVDPIVAVVGRHIIIAGGTHDFEEDPLSVEMYDPDSATWTTCESIPESLKHSSASSWVSTAIDGSKLFLTEKQSGVTHVFDPKTMAWFTPSDLLPDRNISYSVIAFVNNRRFLIGVTRDDNNVDVVKIWQMNEGGFEEIGEMPKGFCKSETFSLCSLGVCMAGDVLYIYSGFNLVICEFFGSECRWRSVRNAEAMMGEGVVMERVVLSCSEVRIGDINNALKSENLRFTPR